jgi:glycerophosphoryl diester phosphodiesterase
MCIGHRGAGGHAPENTLASFRRGFELGAEYVECDFHLSADGVPVIIHDETLGRTTNGEGEVRQKTVAELRRLDAGGWFGAKFKGERIPLLRELFELAEGRGGIVVEAKPPSSERVETPDILARLVKEFARARVIVISVDGFFLRQFKALCAEVATGFLSNLLEGPDSAVEAAKKAFCEILSVNYKKWEDRLADVAQAAGLKTAVWTVNDPKDIKSFLEKGVFSITSDFPERVVDEMRELGHGRQTHPEVTDR